MIIGLVGKKFSGKDTCADYIISRYGFYKLTFAHALKEICRYLFLLDEKQLYDPSLKEQKIETWNLSPREIFQKIGTDLFRNHFDKDFWVKQFELRFMELSRSGKKNIVCSDCRYQNEADLIKKLGGTIILIRRNNIDNNDDHESEKLDIKNIDYIFENDQSLQNLYSQIDDFMKKNNV